MNEFDLIERYLARGPIGRTDVHLGIGDDAALLDVPLGMGVCGAINTIAGESLHSARHGPEVLGHRLLNEPVTQLLDHRIAPAWATLALTLPEIDENWLESFCRAFFALADQHRIALVGGDTTRGPLLVTTVVHGLVEVNR